MKDAGVIDLRVESTYVENRLGCLEVADLFEALW